MSFKSLLKKPCGLYKMPYDITDLKKGIEKLSENEKDISIMEVCGTHTMSIAAAGIKQMLSGNISLISGPGCPVCVTPSERIDDICRLAEQWGVTVATYGDML